MKRKTGELWRRVGALLMAVVFCYGIIAPATTALALEDEAIAEDIQEDAAEVEEIEEAEEAEVPDVPADDETAEEAEVEVEAEAEAEEAEEDVEAEEAPAEEETEEAEAVSYQAGTYTRYGADYTVTVSYDESACFPMGTQLVVREVTEGAAGYAQYYKATEEVVAGENTEIKAVRFFDIAFVSGTEEIEPQAPVAVTVTFPYDEDASGEGRVSVLHMADGAEVVAASASVAEDANEVTASFANDEFSVYGFAYTVDFTYDEYTYRLPGEGSILLSELFAALGIEADVADVEKVEYTDPEQLEIALQEDGDYLITSLKPFETEETLTITLKDGTVIVIDVVDPPATDNTTVDHIDIGVTAAASISIPLAYGKYYDASGNVVLDVAIDNKNEHATGVNEQVPITADDLRAAKITAKRNGENYTNFSTGTNYTEDWGTDPNTGARVEQLRIPGTFGTGTLANPVTYTVEVNKEITVTLERDGETLYTEDGEPITVSVMAALISSFTFFDAGNMCPGIVNGSNVNGNVDWSAGMDFILGTSSDTDTQVTAIEIIKYIVDEDGKTIETEDTYEFDFEVHQNTSGDDTAPTAWSGETTATIDYSGYEQLSDRTLTTSTDGLGVVYDYDVADPALVYIVEKESSIPETITDANGNTLVYDHTYIKTEYAWRGDGGEQHSNVNQDDTYKAIPDVVGAYSSDSSDEDLFNTFLEFYVYNVYVPDTTEVTVTKEWDDNDDQDGIRPDSVTITLEGSDGNTYEVELDGTADDEPEGTDPVGYEVEEWTAKFINLPTSNADGKITYEASEKEADPVTGEDAAGTYAYEVTGSEEDGYVVTNTHTPITTTVKVTKEWEDEDDKDELRPDSISVQLLANGEASGDPVELTADEDWTYTWEDLQGYEEGKAIEYTIEEPEVPEGYEVEVGEVSGTPEDGYEVTITNTHEVEEEEQDVEIEITGTKKLVDSKDDSKEYELEDGEFEFELEIDGEVVATGKNDADGNISITYTIEKAEAGEYKFKVSEVKGDEENVTYDENSFEGTIKIEENEDGKLEATIEGADEIEFVNKYEEPEKVKPVPPSPTPETGDHSTPWLWLAIMLAAGLELASLIYVRVRKNR